MGSTLSRRIFVGLSLSAILVARNGNPAGKTFDIIGMVKHPGRYALRDGIRVMDAIADAGGFADFAHVKKITIIRDGDRLSFSYPDFIKGKNVEQNMPLQNGDAVEVP
jgi:polysaccharide biosynthesis/export protein